MVKKNIYSPHPGFCLAGVGLHILFTLLYLSFPNVYKGLIKANNTNFKSFPFEGWTILSKDPIVNGGGALWKFLIAHSCTTLRVLRRTLGL